MPYYDEWFWNHGQLVTYEWLNTPPVQVTQQPFIQVPVADPAVLQPPEAEQVIEFNEEVEEGNMINNFRVGCDPEFILVNRATGTTDPASHYFPHDGEVGYDHNGRVAEFRPGPSKGVYPLVKKIQALLQKPTVKNIPSKFRAGAAYGHERLGGHIHFGFNPFQGAVPENGGTVGDGDGVGTTYPLTEKGKQISRALDAVTLVLEHLDILPTQESAIRRQCKYGKLGNIRNCKGHMEYRTMASWLYDPKVAFLCLTAAKLAAADPVGAYEALQNCDSFAKFKRWVEGYATKDSNAKRASEKLLDRGLRALQVDPDVDFKERWQELGL